MSLGRVIPGVFRFLGFRRRLIRAGDFIGDIPRGTAEFLHRFPQPAGNRWKILRSEEKKDHDEDQKNFAGPEGPAEDGKRKTRHIDILPATAHDATFRESVCL